MLVSQTRYNASGELMAPLELDVKRRRPTPGGTPSLDAGYYHSFAFLAETKAEIEEKTDRFFSGMARVPGYMTLAAHDYIVEIGTYRRFGVELLYVVEDAAQALAATEPQAAPIGQLPAHITQY